MPKINYEVYTYNNIPEHIYLFCSNSNQLIYPDRYYVARWNMKEGSCHIGVSKSEHNAKISATFAFNNKLSVVLAPDLIPKTKKRKCRGIAHD